MKNQITLIYTLIKNCISFLSPKEKIKVLIFGYFLLLASLLEMCALLAIMPLVSFIIDPDIIMKKEEYHFVSQYLMNFKNSEIIMIFSISSIMLLAFSLSSSFYIQHRVRIFIVNCQNRLASELISKCIEAPYTWYLKRNSTKTSHLIQTDVLYWANDGMLRIMQMIGSLSLLIVGSISLVLVSPGIGLLGFLIISIIGYLVIISTRKPIFNLSAIRRKSHANSLDAFSLIFKGIKDIRINSKEQFFINNFLKYFSSYGKSGVKLRLFQNFSPLIMIFLGQSGIILIAVSLWFKGISSSEIASTMAFIILVISRIMPNATKLISDINGIWAANSHVNSITKLLREDFKTSTSINKTFISSKAWSKIKFNNVSFHYPDTKNRVIKNVSLEIKNGNSYGLVGMSGAGKTTLIDLITGFLVPSFGTIEIDKLKLQELNIKNWRKEIGYVSQTPFLSDSSLKSNIAFGFKENEINEDLINQCILTAQLTEFTNNLPSGINSKLGDSGIRISGGQRQRIAIARALYAKPKLLIFDEATSALDSINESALQKSINNLKGIVTLITIAHRMSTIRDCDNIIVLDNGKLISKGKFNYLIKNCLVIA